MNAPVSICAVLFATCWLVACSSPEAAPSPSAAPAPAPAAAPEPAPSPNGPGAAAIHPAANVDEACGQTIVVAFKGAEQAAPEIKRDKAAALARASELLAQVKGGADFAELARTQSDAPSSSARGGTMGTHLKAEWPALHMPLRDPLFALEVGAVAPEPIELTYGYAVLKRCAIEKAHGRHVLVRYKGAKKADGDVKLTKAQAEDRAKLVLKRLEAGEDFAKLAQEYSDDGSRDRGGDIGTVGRGLLVAPFETALFALQPGGRSGVVESDFGFHVIERLPITE